MKGGGQVISLLLFFPSKMFSLPPKLVDMEEFSHGIPQKHISDTIRIVVVGLRFYFLKDVVIRSFK